jgi:hypothetical protein
MEGNDVGVVVRYAPEQGFGLRLGICSLWLALRSPTLDLNRLANLP